MFTATNSIKHTGCKITTDNYAAIGFTNNDLKTYAITPTAGTSALSSSYSAIAGTSYFTDVAVKPGSSPAKIVASGGNNARVGASYFLNTGGTINEINIVFSNNPIGVINTACYSGEGSYYALGGNDNKIWIMDDATNKDTHVLQDGDTVITNCDFDKNGDYLLAGTDVGTSGSYVYVYKKICFFCSQGFYSDSFSHCAACSVAIPGCSTCYNASYCVTCLEHRYRKDNTTCESCNVVLKGCSTC